MKYVVFAIVTFLATIQSASASVPYDFDGDGISDFFVLRFQIADSTTRLYSWVIHQSNNGTMRAERWGYSVTGFADDALTPADFDGDGKTDLAVYRRYSDAANPNRYFILNSFDNTVRQEVFGARLSDDLAHGDWDGDGKADLAVFRRNIVQSHFINMGSLNNPNRQLTYEPWGSGEGQFSCAGDYDGDGKRDVCVRYTLAALAPISRFVIKRSTDGGVEFIDFGLSTDQLISADVDGDGKTDICLTRSDPSNTNVEWYILERDGGGTGGSPIVWGLVLGDVRFAGPDFDGDGRSDLGVYRTAENRFYIRRSSNGSMMTFDWGIPGDAPTYR